MCREDYSRLHGFVTQKKIRIKNNKGKVCIYIHVVVPIRIVVWLHEKTKNMFIVAY